MKALSVRVLCTLLPAVFLVGALVGGLRAPAAAQSCGNGIIEGAEQCDDGNLVGNDGCSVTCAIESGWTCGGVPSVCAQLPPEPGCSRQDLVSKNAEKCVRTYAASLRRCIRKGLSLDVCDTSKSFPFCNQLSVGCTPKREVDEAIRVIYGNAPVNSECRWGLVVQATKLVAKGYFRGRQGRNERLLRDVSSCVRKGERACATVDPLQAPCDAAQSPQDAASCVCNARPGCRDMSPLEFDGLLAGGWASTRGHARPRSSAVEIGIFS